MNTCLIYNINATRLLYKFDLKATDQLTSEDNPVSNWFSCASIAYSSDTGEEFIAIATNDGRIFRVNV